MTGRNVHFAVALMGLICGMAQLAQGATICVSQKPNSGCPFLTITAAKKPVFFGTISAIEGLCGLRGARLSHQLFPQQ